MSGYLKSKLVEGVVKQVFDAGEEALVEHVAGGSGKESRNSWRRALQLTVVVHLVTIDCCLKNQQHQHNQVILHATKNSQ